MFLAAMEQVRFFFPRAGSMMSGTDANPGTVEDVGEGVGLWKVGDRVVATFIQDHFAGRLSPDAATSCLGGGRPGLLGEFVVLPQTGVVKIPQHLSFEEAACLPCAAVTAWNALYGSVPVRPGDVVLLQGTGGVSMFGLQIARAAGAVTIVTSSSDEKLAKARTLGAMHCINYRTSDWPKEIRAVTNGHGADHILEVGGISTLPQSLQAVAWNGFIHSIGHITNMVGSGVEEQSANAGILTIDTPYTLRRIIVGSREHFEDLLTCFAAHSIRPIIDRVFEFEKTQEAYEYLWGSSHVGKVVIRIP
jgi:NADPH:quinone reductase-like Zn-dependent oxidoreductase